MGVTGLGNDYRAGILPLSVIDDKGKEEDFPISTGIEEELLETASLNTLPNELLLTIFNFATKEGRDGQLLCNLRKVSTRWRDVIDMTILVFRWKNLPKEIQHPILRSVIERLLLVDQFVTNIISSAWGSFEEESGPFKGLDLSSRVQNLGPSAFKRFSSLSQDLTGSPAVLGFEGRSYDAIQSELDRSLGLLWSCCQPNGAFNPKPASDMMVAHRWFNDATQADTRNRRANILLQKNIRILPSEIDKFTRLNWLHLYGNQLRSLPTEIGNLPHLRSLVLGNNLLASIPDAIGNLSQLEVLHLYQNRLTSLPETIGKLTQLKELSVQHNLLINLPVTIGNLICLEKLDLSHNQLTNLPSSLVDYVANSSKLEPSFEHNLLIYLLDNSFKEWDNPLYNFKKHDFVKKYISCSSYECLSPLASLCQEIHHGKEEADLRDAFKRLSDEEKQRIERAWQTFSSFEPSSSLESRRDLFANRADFAKAVMIAIQEKFLAFKEKHHQIYSYCFTKKLSKDFDKHEKGSASLFAHYGKRAADSNILLLIDAMELETEL